MPNPTKYKQAVINDDEETRRKTAQKLGVTEKQLDIIYEAMLKNSPDYWKGYDYNSILMFLIKNREKLLL